MSKRAVVKERPSRFRLHRTEELNRAERIALLLLVVGTVALDIFEPAASAVAPIQRAIGIAATLSLALYIWSPLVATSALGVAVALSFFVDGAIGPFLAAAMAALLVLRVATVPLIIGYAGGFLIFAALLAMGIGSPEDTPVNIAAYLVVAAVSGGLGFALRMAYARGHRLEDELAERAERERAAVLAERKWIAGELHDSIAHHLTVVALHVQLLDDEQLRPESQEAIRVAARKALTDLRFVIQLAEEAPQGTEMPSGDLADAIDEACLEFEAAGHGVIRDGDPSDEGIPRGAEIILARIARESATNILKYAGPGDIHVAVDVGRDAITLTIRSPLPTVPRRDLPSTGTGLNRMAERVLGVSGEFSAGPVDGAWLVLARLPLAEPGTPPLLRDDSVG